MKRAYMLVFILVLCFSFNKTAVAAHSAWAVIDADTGRLLMGSNENVQLPIASLTKVWTAFTLLENGIQLDEKTVITHAAASNEGSSIYLKQGTEITVEGLLYGLMLRSGNDAAYALAEHSGGSVDGFVHLMNELALYYGLEQTHFTNPSGLHDDQHISTAYETALMMSFAMKNEQFKKIASTPLYTLELADETYHWKNKHRLLSASETAVAGKTGFTKAAGRTLVTYFEKDHKRVIVVTLNDGNDWRNHLSYSEQAFSKYKVETVAEKGRYAIIPGIEGELNAPLQLLLSKGEEKRISHLVQIPRNGSPDGKWIVYLDDTPLLLSPIELFQ